MRWRDLFEVRRLLAWRKFWRIVRTVRNADHADAADGTETISAPPAPPPRRRQAKPKTEIGEFYFRGTILDQLDYYFGLLRRMKKTDPENYKMLRLVGAHILPTKGIGDDGSLSAWFKTHRPGYGAVAFGDMSNSTALENLWDKATPEERLKIEPNFADAAYRKNSAIWIPKLLFFTKYKRSAAPIAFARAAPGWDVYKVTIYWDRADKDYQAPQDFGVAVSPDNQIHILPVHIHDWIPVRGRKGSFSVPQERWGIPNNYIRWARINHRDPAELLGETFRQALNGYEYAQYSMIRVEAEKDDLRAAFGVSMTRTPYFFSDRDPTEVTEGGAKRPIFHIVRAHRRLGKFVKTHFRGVREFTWNGYRIKITVPLREHTPVDQFDVSSYDSEVVEASEKLSRRKWLDATAIATMQRKIIDSGFGALIPRKGSDPAAVRQWIKSEAAKEITKARAGKDSPHDKAKHRRRDDARPVDLDRNGG